MWMIWSFSHECVSFDAGIWRVWRSAVVMWWLVMWDILVVGSRGSVERMCGISGCTVGMEIVVGDGQEELYWGKLWCIVDCF